MQVYYILELRTLKLAATSNNFAQHELLVKSAKRKGIPLTTEEQRLGMFEGGENCIKERRSNKWLVTTGQ